MLTVLGENSPCKICRCNKDLGLALGSEVRRRVAGMRGQGANIRVGLLQSPVKFEGEQQIGQFGLAV